MSFKKFIETVLFQSKWLLVPFYLGLIAAQVCYCGKFVVQIYDLVGNYHNIAENEFMLSVLSLIDIVMIANLIKMIITGSYQTFINKVPDNTVESKISSGALKVKMGTSLIGVSSIHLLQTFINSTDLSTRAIVTRCAIHVIFIFSTVGLAFVDYLHEKTKYVEEETEKICEELKKKAA